MKKLLSGSETSKESVAGRKYWKSLDEVVDSAHFNEWVAREFPQGASELEGVNRRHFLKIMAASFGLAGLGLTGCRQPEQHVLPYAKQPERIVPGVPVYYTSSMPGAKENIPLIVETQEARPTKIEGNPSYETYGGATDVYAQASVLNLYDTDRLQKSYGKHRKALMREEVMDLLKAVSEQYGENKGEGLAFLAEQSTSPTRERLVGLLKKKFPEAQWVEYEPVDFSNPEKALEGHFNRPLRPYYHFDKAKRVLAIDADFMHSEPGHLGYARDFAKARRIRKSDEVENMNRFYTAESDYTVTGAMADHRLRIATNDAFKFACLIAAEVFRHLGEDEALIALFKRRGNGLKVHPKWVRECAKDLVEHQGNSVVVAGSHLPEAVHVLVMAINEVLDANNQTVSYLEIPENEANGVTALASSIERGLVSTLVVLGGNPAYNAPGNLQWEKLQKQVKQVIRYGYHFDETSLLADYTIAANHYLESWGDGRTWSGVYVPVQPMILPLFEGFSELEVLGHLAGVENPESYTLVKETFEGECSNSSFDAWLAKGLVEESVYPVRDVAFSAGKLEETIGAFKADGEPLSKDNLELRFTASSVGDGRYCNNGWLQECPDPMTKLTWDNAILIGPRLAREFGEATGVSLLRNPSTMNEIGQANLDSGKFERGKENAYIAQLSLGDKSIRGPVQVQPGLADYTVVLPLGYGRREAGSVGNGTGFDVYPLITNEDKAFATGATLELTGGRMLIANTQEHWSMEGRALIREASAEDYEKNPDFVNKMGVESHSPPIYGAAKNEPLQQKVKDIPRGASAYKTPDFQGGQQWGMSIDLNTCIGCNACIVACQSENNIAVIGKDQVLRGREMHWIRLDRYYSSGSEDKTEIPEDPQVSFMSVLCQHCELAPCENVCPVNATVHDDEGLNVMTYNRCVGTRYCANNCPYKVRRFNFFDWNKRKDGHYYEGPLGAAGVPELEKMQKNPDVTLRMRGVMEKCTYCVQRIEEAKINQRVKARDSGDVRVADGTIVTACQQSCPTGSIMFGDVADPDTEVSQLKAQERDYSLLGYLNTRPRTTYLAKIRNFNPAMPGVKGEPNSRIEYEDRYGHSKHAEHTEATEPHHA